MKKTLRIGTRDSQLALWQATQVEQQLIQLGYEVEVIKVKSEGDLNLDLPLHELGITGAFTKTLDIKMIQGEIDIAVHSMKDVPTRLPKGIVQTAVLPRAMSDDIVVFNEQPDFAQENLTIATGSLRRRAQWLHRYPTHEVVDLRGNVNTRLRKLNESNWAGAIFALAGLKRIDVLPDNYQQLDWMIPAPAQGAIVVVACENVPEAVEATAKLNDERSAICVAIERQFMQKLEGGCTAPIGAHAVIDGDTIDFEGVLFTLDGQTKVSVKKRIAISDATDFGAACAQEVLANGGTEIMEVIKKELNL